MGCQILEMPKPHGALIHSITGRRINLESSAAKRTPVVTRATPVPPARITRKLDLGSTPKTLAAVPKWSRKLKQQLEQYNVMDITIEVALNTETLDRPEIIYVYFGLDIGGPRRAGGVCERYVVTFVC